MPMQDQAVWSNVNATVNGTMTSFGRGALLPDPVTGDESAERTLLRIGGALRTVEVVPTEEELLAQIQARAEATSAREVAADVDPAATTGNQVAGAVEPGPPTLHTGAGAPVVIGKDKPPAGRDAGGKFASAGKEE